MGWLIPMLPRSRDERHRTSTPLELFFDLVFVVAIAQASQGLHHAVAEGHIGEAVLSYSMVFFAIWWAWMNFTWFASAYDTDDVAYRFVVFVQLTGALILAAGVADAFAERDFRIVTIGYVVMRLAMVTQWLRAARSDLTHRTTAQRFALGVAACQLGWVALVFSPTGATVPAFAALMIAELLVPVWAERAERTSWHPGHVTERYGLFTIIVLGESVLAASTAIASVIRIGALIGDLASTIVGGLLILFCMWWHYFGRPARELTTLRAAFIWGYGHFVIFASAAAVGAGLGVAADHAARRTEIGTLGAGASVAIPVAIYLLAVWALHERPRAEGAARALVPSVALLVLLTPLTGQAALATGLLLTIFLAARFSVREARSSNP